MRKDVADIFGDIERAVACVEDWRTLVLCWGHKQGVDYPLCIVHFATGYLALVEWMKYVWENGIFLLTYGHKQLAWRPWYVTMTSMGSCLRSQMPLSVCSEIWIPEPKYGFFWHRPGEDFAQEKTYLTIYTPAHCWPRHRWDATVSIGFLALSRNNIATGAFFCCNVLAPYCLSAAGACSILGSFCYSVFFLPTLSHGCIALEVKIVPLLSSLYPTVEHSPIQKSLTQILEHWGCVDNMMYLFIHFCWHLFSLPIYSVALWPVAG